MAREWAAGKSFKIVWKTCKYPDWMQWLIRNRNKVGVGVYTMYSKSTKQQIKEWGGVQLFRVASKKAHTAWYKEYNSKKNKNKPFDEIITLASKASCNMWRKLYIVE